MHAPVVTKFAFRIRTRVGMVVDNLLIPGRDQTEAQRKLRQIYRDCEILTCVCHRGGGRASTANYGDVVKPITR